MFSRIAVVWTESVVVISRQPPECVDWMVWALRLQLTVFMRRKYTERPNIREAFMKFESESDVHVTRRTFLAACAAGSALATALPAAGALPGMFSEGLGTDTSLPVQSALSLPLQRVFSPLGPNTVVYEGFVIADLYVQGFAVVIELENSSNDHLRIDVCRRDPLEPIGIAHSEQFDLILMNNGAGSSATPAQVERIARMIAAVLRRTEVSLPFGAAELHTHGQRLALFETHKLHFDTVQK